MSRSRKHIPIIGMMMAPSEKRDKVRAHRQERRVIKAILQYHADDTMLPAPKLFGDPWGADKDGKHRFDPECHPKLMRK
jgi:hypothetical protein